eukprot:CAMPEP_0204588134 /NCGR_PEP_ID=MMETSP0661-20131031/48451_1 /ASSEMBLY_ACC=CAM_ASM_000606 /TAXON_ID=109239 /ORGANISM="Alexandrium margalefi, Strain AMGDE01CS-322" /LENGTH=55 /DNA_ID=CAMNT_0051597927 /DNA_START=40 /DNA_END=204 /DNA_ORIENTATION=+
MPGNAPKRGALARALQAIARPITRALGSKAPMRCLLSSFGASSIEALALELFVPR